MEKNTEGFTINKAAIVGFGAIGCIYGRRLYHLMGDNFAVIAGGKRAERLRLNGETINGEKIMPSVVEPENQYWKADLVIFAVKNHQLDSAINDIKNIITPDTIILPILNGVSAKDKINAAYPQNTVLYGLSKSDSQRTSNGINCTWEGLIQFGEANNTVVSEKVMAVKELFDKAKIPNEICEDMLRAVWIKFMRNVGMNQLSAITGATYSAFSQIEELNKALREVMAEVMCIAQSKGINITESDIEESVKIVCGSAPEGKTSMLQDIEAKRKSEVESFSGTVIEEGKKTGIPTPWNNSLYLLIRTKEKLYGAE
ncbi:ketopantoate reductase family protein [Lachnospiraceae bacterium NSJ-143]|nr:ketopantoate reductase family protein [Lachnospiraceae bacterium NSJ-143]